MLIRLRSVHLCSYLDALSRQQVLHTYIIKLYIVNEYKKVDRIGTSALKSSVSRFLVFSIFFFSNEQDILAPIDIPKKDFDFFRIDMELLHVQYQS